MLIYFSLQSREKGEGGLTNVTTVQTGELKLRDLEWRPGPLPSVCGCPHWDCSPVSSGSWSCPGTKGLCNQENSTAAGTTGLPHLVSHNGILVKIKCVRKQHLHF